MENNINMNYENLTIVRILLLIIFIAFIVVTIFLKLGFNVILSSEIHNKEIEVKISVICFFNLINITKVVYPISKTDEVRSNTYLYNRTRATIGDKVELTSQTYRNSEYTVFIRMGSTGGNQASAQDAIKVYGQWNGTNLLAN